MVEIKKYRGLHVTGYLIDKIDQLCGEQDVTLTDRQLARLLQQNLFDKVATTFDDGLEFALQDTGRVMDMPVGDLIIGIKSEFDAFRSESARKGLVNQLEDLVSGMRVVNRNVQ